MSSYVERNLLDGETVLYRARVSPWGLAPLLLLGLLLIPAVGLGLILLLWAWVIYATTEFALTDRRVIAKTGLIARRSIEMFLDKVESFDVSQSILGRLLNYGTVTIVGTGATKEPISSISAPLTLRRHFMEAADGYRGKP
jgi:uncharacterized membrane protein YdbT with pleckstrin-like domain